MKKLAILALLSMIVVVTYPEVISPTAFGKAVEHHQNNPALRKFITAGYEVTNGLRTAAIKREDIGGNLDATFGNNGIVRPNLGNVYSSYITEVKLQLDGKIFVKGRVTSGQETGGKEWEDQYLFEAHYNSDGTPDITFGKNGVKLIIEKTKLL